MPLKQIEKPTKKHYCDYCGKIALYYWNSPPPLAGHLIWLCEEHKNSYERIIFNNKELENLEVKK